MTAGNAMPDTSSGAAAQAPAFVRVWDPFVRVFHWSLVFLFAVAFISGDESETLHLVAGYIIAGLVALRIIWGLIGTRYARFKNFVTGPRAVADFLSKSLRLEAPRYIGHNPAGGAMVLALLLLMIALAITGHLMVTETFWGSKEMEEIHEALANISLVLVGLHLVGVVLAGYEHGENLIRAMFTGLKRAPGPGDHT